jgi:hypothetical protein
LEGWLATADHVRTVRHDRACQRLSLSTQMHVNGERGHEHQHREHRAAAQSADDQRERGRGDERAAGALAP